MLMASMSQGFGFGLVGNDWLVSAPQCLWPQLEESNSGGTGRARLPRASPTPLCGLYGSFIVARFTVKEF